jgi:hypothetical protein
MTTCPHGKQVGVGCYVCKAERVQAAIQGVMPLAFRQALERVTPDADCVPDARAVAIVALRRIVDRAVSDEVSSLATADILRIALRALNQLED